MIDLSTKAAKRFKIKWSDLKSRSCDYWKIDIEMFGRVPMLLIVHEYTLFTLVRRKSKFKSPLDVVGEIQTICHWYRCSDPFSLGKNNDPKIKNKICWVGCP